MFGVRTVLLLRLTTYSGKGDVCENRKSRIVIICTGRGMVDQRHTPWAGSEKKGEGRQEGRKRFKVGYTGDRRWLYRQTVIETLLWLNIPVY